MTHHHPLISSALLLSGALSAAAPVLAAPAPVPPQVASVTAEDLGMERQTINYADGRMWFFNGYHRIHAGQWSTTAFSMPGYRFRFDFAEKRSGICIRDNINEDAGDPLGYNFRPGAPYCIVAQDDTWYPHKEVRTGTFHRKFKTGLTSFSIKTETLAAVPPRRACLVVTLTNRGSEPLTLTLQPVQNGRNLIQLPLEKRFISVTSDLTETNGQGFVWTLPPGATETHSFVVLDSNADDRPPAVGNPAVADLVARCRRQNEDRVRSIASRLPAIRTQSPSLDHLYRRSMAGLPLLRWEGAEFRNHPQWVLGGAFVCLVSWDFSYAADTLSLVDPKALRGVARDVLGIGQMRGSYIDVHRARCDWVLYLQDPFALKEIISRYLVITGDRSILDDRTGGATVYEWLERWGDKLHDQYGTGPDGLINIGDNDQLLIEIRTSDYNHIVPAVNGLAADYYHWLARLAAQRGDPDEGKFARLGDTLQKALRERLWNEKEGWFDCLYDDGSRRPVFTAHLFDLIGTDVLTEQQRRAVQAHITEGEFLAPYGMYSISRKDTIHWDRMDADWGGGGAYIGIPFRVARNLYQNGDPGKGWDILKRMARLMEHFCFMPQSPWADVPNEHPHGGNLDIAGSSAMEAIWSGIFGLRPQEDGSLVVTPAPFNPEVGEAELAGYQFRQHRYDVRLLKTGYEAFVDGQLAGRESYGRPVVIPPQPVIPPPPPAWRTTASSVEEEYRPDRALDGSHHPTAAWISQPYGGGTKEKPLDVWWALESLKATPPVAGLRIYGDHRDIIPLLRNLQVQTLYGGVWKTFATVESATDRDLTLRFPQAQPVSDLRIFVPAADLPGDGYVRICEVKLILPDGSEESPASWPPPP